MIDTHCHLTHPKFDADLDAVVERAKQAKMQACITIGTGTDDASTAAALAQRHAGFVFCTAGIDPFSAYELGSNFGAGLRDLKRLLESGDYVALGEIGLDYHYDLCPRAVQRKHLEQQLALAQTQRLPVVIHVRDAHDDMAAILRNFPDVDGVIHSFTGTPADAQAYIDIGWHIAFNGIATFANANPIRQAAIAVPADRVLVETDSPYLAPVPKRGKRCEPVLVSHVIDRLATLRGTTAQALCTVTSENAVRLFRLPLC